MSNLIKKLKTNKAKRTSGIETRFVKYANPVISVFLSKLINSCISDGIYADSLKVAEVILIFKNGGRDRTTNYRPISLLSQFNKVFEKILYNRIYSHLIRYKLLREYQFGFRKNSSTTLAISKIYDESLNNIDQGMYTCCIFLDLKKAFDTVDHYLLLQKLEITYGFGGVALDIMKSYLTNRQQFTKIRNKHSTKQNINCGIPQGFLLGPLLFILYINNLPSASLFSSTLFADDTLLSMADKHLDTLEKRVNSELKLIDDWLQNNKLSLNYSETCYLLFNKHPHILVNSKFSVHMNHSKIEKSNSVKYLGLLIDDKLNCSAHAQYLSLQLAKCCSMLYQVRGYVTEQTLIMLYHSFACSRISYRITAWGTAANKYLKEIETKLNKIMRTITWNKKFSRATQLYKNLKLLKLRGVYNLELVKFMHQIYSNKIFTKLEKIHSHKIRTPSSSNFFSPRVSKNAGQKKLGYRGVKLWNSLDESLKSKSLILFKKNYKKNRLQLY